MFGVTLFKRKGKAWYAKITQDGHITKRSMGTTNRQDAEIRKAEIVMELREGAYYGKPKAAGWTIRQLLEHYIEAHSKLKKKSWETDVYYTNSISRLIGTKIASKVTYGNILEYEAARKNAGVSDATLVHEILFLDRAYKFAIDKSLLRESPVAKWERPKLKNARSRSFTTDEMARLFAELPANLVPIVTLGINTGLRRGNLAGLKWGWVDLKAGVIVIPAEEYKNGHSHEVVLNKAAYGLLRDLRSNRPTIARIDSAPYVFLNKLGQPYNPNSITRLWRRACEKANVKDAKFHDLRHHFCTELYKKGATPFDIQHAAGHDDLRSTQRYTHKDRDRQRKVVGLLD